MTDKEKLWRDQRLTQIRQWQAGHQSAGFIDADAMERLLTRHQHADPAAALDVVRKARQNATSGALLSPEDVAILVNARDPLVWEAVFDAANWIKQTVYGKRIVIFAPLYVASLCVNDCLYCGFRTGNPQVEKRVLTSDELGRELQALLQVGHKRLIMVYGEHPECDHEYICRTVRETYAARVGPGDIRRVNINAAPLFENECRMVKSEGIGTYQIFQETYHRPTYEKLHPRGTLKGEYDWRLLALHRAQTAGIDDVGLGVLFGLYDWRFELLGLLAHAAALEREFGIGPHTISYPRLEPAAGTPFATSSPWLVNDDDFRKIVAVIRLMCPYTGSILTARERPELRREVMRLGGVSQMDAGSRIGVGGYAQMEQAHLPDRQQFMLADTRSLDDFIRDLCQDGYLPSFCTAGYREGRTGANFMPLAKHATVKNFCIANGILTFQEYLLDYASDAVRRLGNERVLPAYLAWLDQRLPEVAGKVRDNLQRMQKEAKRDLRF